MEDLVKELGLSRSHLSRAYRQATGSTLRDSILQPRLSAARAALEGTDRPITDIALDCGFASASHMASTFKARLGLSPRALRRSAQ